MAAYTHPLMQVAFFCANMLLAKTRAEWSGTPQEQRQAISHMVR